MPTVALTAPPFTRYLREKIRNCATLRSRRLCPMRGTSWVTEWVMRGIRIVGAGLAIALAVAMTPSGAQAQATPGEPAGKPLALLAGLRPPHESKHAVHAKAAHATARKTAAKKTRHARMAVAHTRHISARKIAKSEHEDHAVAASAFAEEPPAQATPNPAPADGWPVANSPPPGSSTAAPATGRTVAPVSESTAPDVDATSNPTAVKIQTVKITSPDQVNTLALTADRAAPAATMPSDHPAVAPPQHTALAAPAHQDASAVGSASWIAQVLAALGGAVAAGAVAWFLIGGGPVRTYG